MDQLLVRVNAAGLSSQRNLYVRPRDGRELPQCQPTVAALTTDIVTIVSLKRLAAARALEKMRPHRQPNKQEQSVGPNRFNDPAQGGNSKQHDDEGDLRCSDNPGGTPNQKILPIPPVVSSPLLVLQTGDESNFRIV